MRHFLGTPFIVFPFILLFISQIRVLGEAYSNVTCIESERKALVQFRQSLIDSKSNRLSSWTGEECCVWEGVGCSKSTGHVVKVDLHNPMLFDESEYGFNPEYYYSNFSNNCLGGQLNPSLVNLKYLQHLDLSLNNFSDPTIPTFLGLLKKLRYLNLSDTGLGGEIPHHLGNLSSLQILDLSVAPSVFFAHDLHNSLTTKNLLWVVRLSSLKRLYLSYVTTIEDPNWLLAINMLPSLTSLELAACKLPTIPDHLSQVNLTSLASLDLGGNLLNSIPLWLFNLTGLLQLNLRVNSIHGPIHDAFDQMTSLVYLDLYDNNINTSIPKSLCNMSNLAYLNLADNHLEGSIPSEIGHLAQLTKLILSHNNLKGSVPSSLGKVKKLQILYISDNMLSGVLSELHFEKLKELKKLTIYNNDLALNFSSSWIPPFQLRYIDMAYMKIGPRFPTWLQNQRELEELNLRGTGISDTIPNWFRLNCCNITTLDLSFNSISGNPLLFRQINHGPPRGMLLNNNKFEGSLASFPPDILELDLSGNLLKGNVPIPDVDTTTTVAMQFLTLNDNRLTGTIPKELCKMNRLETLDLSNNQLSGRLPSCLGNWRNLRELNLAKNSLSGQIPGSLGDLENLVILHMDRNKFIGNLGLISQNLKSLQFLDLGENDLEDFIPAWIGEKLLDLEFLRLESNNFQGGISYKLCQLTKLQVLNLAGNHLTGSIPHCFNNFSMMLNDAPGGLVFFRSPTTRSLSNFFKGRELEFTSNLVFLKSISLSNNKLVGEIPEEIMDLAGLQNLNLSKNHLSGRIPDRIGNLKHLESLDLSINQLFGGIPPSLSAINSLSYLNVSYNNLSGRIPSGNQLQTLTDPSIYQGNGGLCGKPLLKNCPGDNTPASFYDRGHHESDHFTWFYAGIGPGFAIGLVGVLSVLHFKKSWRYAYFKFVENAHNRLCVMIAHKASQLRRGISTD